MLCPAELPHLTSPTSRPTQHTSRLVPPSRPVPDSRSDASGARVATRVEAHGAGLSRIGRSAPPALVAPRCRTARPTANQRPCGQPAPAAAARGAGGSSGTVCAGQRDSATRASAQRHSRRRGLLPTAPGDDGTPWALYDWRPCAVRLDAADCVWCAVCGMPSLTGRQPPSGGLGAPRGGFPPLRPGGWVAGRGHPLQRERSCARRQPSAPAGRHLVFGRHGSLPPDALCK